MDRLDGKRVAPIALKDPLRALSAPDTDPEDFFERLERSARAVQASRDATRDPGNEALHALLDAYLDGRSIAGLFTALAASKGWKVTAHDGVIIARTATGKIAAYRDVWPTKISRRRLSRIPCATCGALPVGGSGDADRRYPATCQHEPIWP